MQAHLAHAPARKWLRWGRALLFGVVLAALQLLLLSHAAALGQWSTSPLPALAIGALLYFLIPAVEGCLSALPHADVSEGVGAGCLVGGASFLALFTAAAVETVLILTTPDSLCCQSLFAASLFSPFGGILLLVLALIVAGIGGLGGGVVGGWIGGLIGQRLAQKSN